MSWLSAFGRGEDMPTAHLVAVTDAMGPEMQTRVLNRLNEAFVARQKLWVQALIRDQDAVVDPTPLSLATNLVQARTRLRPLLRLTRNELLPGSVRDALREALSEAVRSAQRNLTESVRRAPVGADALLTTVLDNDLTAVLTEPVSSPEQSARAMRRTIIL